MKIHWFRGATLAAGLAVVLSGSAWAQEKIGRASCRERVYSSV